MDVEDEEILSKLVVAAVVGVEVVVSATADESDLRDMDLRIRASMVRRKTRAEMDFTKGVDLRISEIVRCGRVGYSGEVEDKNTDRTVRTERLMLQV